MYYVYILRLITGKFYVGKSADLQQRVQYHRLGKVRSTKPYRPVELVYYEAYNNSHDASRRELFLKTGDGRQTLKKQLKHALSAHTADKRGPFV